MQPNRDPNAPDEAPRPNSSAEPQPTVREKSDDPAVVITRTGSSYNTRVITAAVIAVVLLLVVWMVVRQRGGPGSDVASAGEVSVDSSPIPQRDAAPGTPGATTPYWPAVPYSTGQPSQQVITPSPYTNAPMPYPGEVPSYPSYSTPVMPQPTPTPPPAPTTLGTQTPTTPQNAGTTAVTPAKTVFPRLDSILGIPVDSQGRARVPQRHDTVTHIDSVLRRPTTPEPAPTPVVTPAPTKPVMPPKADTTQSAPTIPLGSTTRADTSAAT
jgi:hypothetical protein